MTTRDFMMMMAIVVTAYFTYDYFFAGGRQKSMLQ